jgi:class 3 adenylate cyclase/tetratricopeptide (TPR) repeat protein
MSNTLPPEPYSCPRCTRLGRAGARFCDACGAPLRAEDTPNSDQEGELKYVSVMFADIVNSTDLVASRSPDDAEAILSPTVRLMLDAVHAFGGIVNQLRGDGVLALFGAPQSQEDQALRACCAALRMHEAANLSEHRTSLRVGVASGLTFLSNAGFSIAGAYPASGATLHLASRLQSMAKPGTTLCDASTRAVAGPSVEFASLGKKALRGFSNQQDVFVLTGVRHSTSRFSEAVSRGLSPLVGRDSELDELNKNAARVRAGSAAAVSITGEAGVGKSRLAWEFTKQLQTSGWRIVQAEAVSYGRNVPYQVIGAVLRSTFEIDPSIEPSALADGIRRQVAEIGDATICVGALLSLLALPLGEDAAAWDELDPLLRGDALRDTVRTLFDAISRRQSVVLLLEDLQWSDQQSLKLLDFVPSSGCRVLLLTTHRPDFAPTLTGLATSVISLAALSPGDAQRLMQEAFPAVADHSLRQRLVVRSAGNPFFLEELARNVLATDISKSHTHIRQPEIPLTIQAVIAARLDRLDAEHKRIVTTASALGNRFSLKILRAIFDSSSDVSFHRRLRSLCDSGMLQQSDTDEASFSHALIQEVAYSGVPRMQRRDLHSQIVAALSRLHSGRLDEHAEMIVYHASLGEVWEELVKAAFIAGRRAAGRSAYVEASRLFDCGIDACRHLPRSSDRLRSEIDLRFELRNTLFPTAGIERSLANSTDAEKLAGELGDRHRLGWATAYVARDLQLVGRPGAAMVSAARALEFADGDRSLTRAAQYFGAQAAYSRGDYANSVATLRKLIHDLESHDPLAWAGTPGPSVIFYRAWLIWALSQQGHADESVAVARVMRRLADEVNLPLCRTIAHLSEGFALALAGHLREAEVTLRSSLSLCRKWEFFAWSTNICLNLGHVLARLGLFEEAFDLFQQAIDRTTTSGIFVNHALELARFAEAHHLAGRPDEAARLSTRAIEVACLYEERGNQALATVTLAEASSALGWVTSAKAHYATALRLGTECQMASVILRCNNGLSKLSESEGTRVANTTI